MPEPNPSQPTPSKITVVIELPGVSEELGEIISNDVLDYCNTLTAKYGTKTTKLTRTIYRTSK